MRQVCSGTGAFASSGTSKTDALRVGDGPFRPLSPPEAAGRQQVGCGASAGRLFIPGLGV